MEKKDKIKQLAEDMLNDSVKHIKEKIEIALNSAAIDVEGWDENSSPMILPKCILAAALDSEAYQYKAIGTSHERKIAKEIRSIRYYI